jgi:hypothetical protein
VSSCRCIHWISMELKLIAIAILSSYIPFTSLEHGWSLYFFISKLLMSLRSLFQIILNIGHDFRIWIKILCVVHLRTARYLLICDLVSCSPWSQYQELLLLLATVRSRCTAWSIWFQRLFWRLHNRRLLVLSSVLHHWKDHFLAILHGFNLLFIQRNILDWLFSRLVVFRDYLRVSLVFSSVIWLLVSNLAFLHLSHDLVLLITPRSVLYLRLRRAEDIHVWRWLLQLALDDFEVLTLSFTHIVGLYILLLKYGLNFLCWGLRALGFLVFLLLFSFNRLTELVKLHIFLFSSFDLWELSVLSRWLPHSTDPSFLYDKGVLDYLVDVLSLWDVSSLVIEIHEAHLLISTCLLALVGIVLTSFTIFVPVHLLSCWPLLTVLFF